MKKHHWMLGALGLGIVAGLIAQPFAGDSTLQWINTNIFQFVGQVFLRLIFMVVVPLLIAALILGAAELSSEQGLGGVAGKTLGFTLVSSFASVVIGVLLVQSIGPGRGVQGSPAFEQMAGLVEGARSDVGAIQKNAESTKPVSQILLDLIPKNPLDSAVRAFSGEIIALMVFALIFGTAMGLVSRTRNVDALKGVLEGMFTVCMEVIGFAMKIAPFAVFGLVFGSVLKFGTSLLGVLALYVLVVVLGLLIQQFVVYGALLKIFAKVNPFAFFKACREVYLVAFSTASSNVTLPVTLETAERDLGITPRIARFVLTVGASANQNGTALFEGVTVLFLAQVYGIDLSLAAQFQVVLMSVLAGIGTAGVPGGSLPLIMILVQSLGIPPEGMGIILGVDRFLDMCRTTLNVSGDLVIAKLVDHKNHLSA